jgi:hypothetical protein
MTPLDALAVLRAFRRAHVGLLCRRLAARSYRKLEGLGAYARPDTIARVSKAHPLCWLLIAALGCSTSTPAGAGGSSASPGGSGGGGQAAPRAGGGGSAGSSSGAGGRVAAGGSGGGGRVAAGGSGGGGKVAADGGMATDAAVSSDGGVEPDARSSKRGVAYDFCEGDGQGDADIALLRAGDTPGSGSTWFYNWGAAPGGCFTSDFEYVPMVWGLTNAGSACEDEDAACFNDGLTVKGLITNIPQSSRYLLGFNEPNFARQSNLTPTTAARAWKHLERIAEARQLQLVAPATNYCDTNPDNNHDGSCTLEPAEHVFDFDAYDLTVPAGHRYNAFEWAELFYDECKDCQIDYQAGHVYSYWGLEWYVNAFKKKAGLLEASEAHCKNGSKDADEFAVDCGGNSCAACSDWARAQFKKALWLTEFAPSTDDGPSPRPDRTALEARATAYIQAELPKLEGDAYVFRYAWFMPRTNIASLDHVDLLTDSKPPTRTAAGSAYTNAGH